jgi:hypothetical protein
LFALFGTAVWLRIRRTSLHPLVAVAALLGATVATTAQLIQANAFFILGDIGHKTTTSASTLQAWHVLASAIFLPAAAGVEILLLTVALAGILAAAFPRWLAWSALVIGLLQLTPVSFFVFVVFMLWTAAASIAMFLRPAEAARAPAPGAAMAPIGEPA